jgi:D-amino peptidase
MEGICGVTNGAMTETNHFDFGRARELMTGDVIAAILGCLDAGATEITVKDAHGTGNNILLEKLPAPVRLNSGWSPSGRMMEGLDASYDAALLVGYHARVGTEDGCLCHTMTGVVRGLWYNDREVGEAGISAADAGHFGVPVVYASGDAALAREIAELLGPQVVTTIVKTAIARECVTCLPLEEARAAIRRDVNRALEQRNAVSPFLQGQPIEVKMRLQTPEQAAEAAKIPTARRVDALTVAAPAPNGLAAATVVCALYEAAR